MEKLNVNVGDKVILCRDNVKRITEVTKILPTGRIRVKDSKSMFSPDGHELGSGWYKATLFPYTEEIAKEIRETNTKRNAVYRMLNVKPSLADTISLEDARAINRILYRYE